MPALSAKPLQDLLEAKDFSAAERLLADAPVAEIRGLWPSLSAMNRLVVFKLLDAAKAMDVYSALPFADQYFVLCGFPLQSIAPILEDLTYAQRRPFVQLPRDFYERMFRKLAEVR